MYLMLVDNEVLELSSDLESYRIINPKLLPYELYYIQCNTGFIEDIRAWLGKRFLYKNLKNYKAIIDSLSLKQQSKFSLDLVLEYNALSVTDCYWIKFNDNEKFDDLDLHKISLSETVIDIALLGIFSTIQLKDLKANVNLRGTFAKTWIRKEDGLHLYKIDIQDDTSVYSELYAQLLINQMNVSNCGYKNVVYKGYNCTDTKCFTDRNTMLLHNKSCYEYFKIKGYKSIEKMFPNDFYRMCLVDYIIGNTDRHDENFGILVDSSTNEIIRFAPLYDHNISMVKTVVLNQRLRQFNYSPTSLPILESALNALKYLKGNFPLEYEHAPDFVEERIKILKANYKGDLVSTYVKDYSKEIKKICEGNNVCEGQSHNYYINETDDKTDKGFFKWLQKEENINVLKERFSKT